MIVSIILLSACFMRGDAANSSNETKNVEYYRKLLQEEMSEANNFILPTDNRRYFGDNVPDNIKDFGEFDFIIVGAGSSGSVIFNRLSKVKKWKILLLEAGGNENDFSDIPGMLLFTHLSEMNWGYNTTSQKKSCLGMNNNRCFYPRGRVVGGSGTINALMYVRGNRKDYDKWEELGNPGWSYDNVLPYFKRSEHFENEDGDDYYHSRTGMWNVSYVKPPGSSTEYYLDANEEMGYKRVDYNGKNQIGYSRLQMNINKGKRASGGRSFIDPVRHEPNVNLVTNALVTKILINSCNDAYGVNFLKEGQLYRAKAKKEVILSAGAINTPQLLMLSGIGPKEHLEELKIPVIKNLPVGKHFQDHPVFIALNIRTNITFRRPEISELIEDFLRGKGLLTYAGNSQVVKFINTLDPQSTIPDIELIFLGFPSTTVLESKVYNLKPEFAETASKKHNVTTDLKIYIVLLHPKSIGEVTLKSDSPLDFPNIDTNYFTDENDDDVETMYRGMKHVEVMLETEAFKRINARLRGIVANCDQYVFMSREYCYCSIRHLSSTLYHASGTTRMGRNPKISVVNNELKVHGIKNLRIGDCGVMPSTISGHNNAPAFMIGEKLADLLKQVHL